MRIVRRATAKLYIHDPTKRHGRSKLNVHDGGGGTELRLALDPRGIDAAAAVERLARILRRMPGVNDDLSRITIDFLEQ